MPTTNMDAGGNDDGRPKHLSLALLLSYISVVWGTLGGGAAIVAGLLAGSLGSLGLGLNVMADVAGSLGLIWRFRVERQDLDRARHAEAIASIAVATALAIVAITLSVAAITQLIARSTPSRSTFALVSAGCSFVVLMPLGVAKRRTGVALQSRALKGDGTLSLIGSALGAVTLMGLFANQILKWWWADRVVALGVALVAAAESLRIFEVRTRLARRRDSGG